MKRQKKHTKRSLTMRILEGHLVVVYVGRGHGHKVNCLLVRHQKHTVGEDSGFLEKRTNPFSKSLLEFYSNTL